MFSNKHSLRFLVAAVLLVISGVCGFVAVSLFEGWAHVPFWLHSGALLGGLMFLAIAGHALWRERWNVLTAPLSLTLLSIVSVVSATAMVVGFLDAGPAARDRVVQGFKLSLRQPPTEAILTLTAAPPAYLDAPKQSLFSPANGAFARHVLPGAAILPEGTVLKIAIGKTNDFVPDIVYNEKTVTPLRVGTGRYAATVVLQESGKLAIRIGPYVSFAHAVELIPDHTPSLALVKAPVLTKRDSIKLQIAYSDDHGLRDLVLKLSRRGPRGWESETLPLSFIEGGALQGTQTAYLNLLAHPWAGSAVETTVVGTDALGQVGRSKTVSLRLPHKDFVHPVASALASIRSALVNNPERQNAQMHRLDTLTQDRTLFTGRLGLYTSLRSAYWKLRSVESEADVAQVVRLLWQLALAFENDGSEQQQNIVSLFEEMTALLTSRAPERNFETVYRQLAGKLTSLADREPETFSTRTGMISSADPSLTSPVVSLPMLLSRMRALHDDGQKAEALDVLLMLQEHFET